MAASTKKELGQNWLADSSSLKAVVAAAQVDQEDFVLEVGPGLGYLTDKLIKQGANVLALEFDRDLIPRLVKKYEYLDEGRFKVELGDIRKYNLNDINGPYKICANIPYYLTSNLLRLLTDTDNKPQAAGLLVQKEVAERVAASTKRSKLAVIVQSAYHVELGLIVDASLFEPEPNVDSRVLSLAKRQNPLVDPEQWHDFTSFLAKAYSSPRKTLRSNLSIEASKEDIERMLEKLGLSPQARAEELLDADWVKLFKEFTGQINS